MAIITLNKDNDSLYVLVEKTDLIRKKGTWYYRNIWKRTSIKWACSCKCRITNLYD